MLTNTTQLVIVYWYSIIEWLVLKPCELGILCLILTFKIPLCQNIFAHSFWLFLFDNGESLLQIKILYCWAFHHKFCTFFEDLITFVHVCSCHCKWRCLKLSPHVYNTRYYLWMKFGMSNYKMHFNCTWKDTVHRRLDFPFGLSLLWEILSCSFQTQIEFCKCL
jgi:hypothetical protein